jgi:hypothetical protein
MIYASTSRIKVGWMGDNWVTRYIHFTADFWPVWCAAQVDRRYILGGLQTVKNFTMLMTSLATENQTLKLKKSLLAQETFLRLPNYRYRSIVLSALSRQKAVKTWI